jgi:Ala-tRNA(Pro) deacylase
MLSTQLTQLLDGSRVPYAKLQHPAAFTSQETAGRLHIDGWQLAKATILSSPSGFVMAVLPAPCRVDVERLSDVVGEPLRLATEAEFEDLFPECEIGAMPPFGHLYGIPVYMDIRLRQTDSIVFNGGTHTEAIRMRTDDFRRLALPEMANFAELTT